MTDITQDFYTALKKDDKILLGTIEEKHNAITKFVTYCLRILNKYGYTPSYQLPLVYHILVSIDKIVDFIKYAARQQSKTPKIKPAFA